MYHTSLLIASFSLCFVGVVVAARADDGMYPMSELPRLNLAEKGIELTADQLFNPNQVSLVDGICRVNGCTGSFVSASGLIITNHHCAFDAIQKASTADNDLLTNGFSAATREQEISAPDYQVRITENYRDVSEDVLKAVSDRHDVSGAYPKPLISDERNWKLPQKRRTRVCERKWPKCSPGKRTSCFFIRI